MSYARVAESIRSDIVTGRFRPGDRLPTRQEIKTRFDTTFMTVHRAAQQLIEEGFIHAAGSAGTFIVESPPHLAHFALVFPDRTDPDTGYFKSSFYTALIAEASAINGRDSRKLEVFENIDGRPDAAGYQQLLDEVRTHRRAGLIFARSPHLLAQTPLILEPDIPRVALMNQSFWPQVDAVYPDRTTFFRSALARLVREGRKRVACITTITDSDAAGFLAMAAEAGAQTHGRWRQCLAPWYPHSIRPCVDLLMHGAGSSRPDALIVADDNLVPGVTEALVALGMDVPGDLEVIAFANFPWPTASAVLVKRLGFDVREMMRFCVQYVENQRAGKSVPHQTLLPAVWEEEVASGK